MKKLQIKKTAQKPSPKNLKEETDKKPISDMGIGFRVVEHVQYC